MPYGNIDVGSSRQLSPRDGKDCTAVTYTTRYSRVLEPGKASAMLVVCYLDTFCLKRKGFEGGASGTDRAKKLTP